MKAPAVAFLGLIFGIAAGGGAVVCFFKLSPREEIRFWDAPTWAKGKWMLQPGLLGDRTTITIKVDDTLVSVLSDSNGGKVLAASGSTRAQGDELQFAATMYNEAAADKLLPHQMRFTYLPNKNKAVGQPPFLLEDEKGRVWTKLWSANDVSEEGTR